MHFLNKIVLLVLVSLHVLPAKGADISEEQKALNIALIRAVTTNRIDDTRALLIRGAHINFDTGSQIHRSLHVAAQYGHKEMLKLLLAQGVDVDIADKYGFTALMWAAWRGDTCPAHTSCVETLLEHKAVIDATTCSGYTALMGAALIGHLQITKLLLDHGANASIIDTKGFTAAMIADRQRHAEVAQTIRWSPLRSAWIGAVCRKQEPLDLD